MELTEVLAEHAELRRRRRTGAAPSVQADFFWTRDMGRRIWVRVIEQTNDDGIQEYVYETSYVIDGLHDMPGHSFVEGSILDTRRLRTWLLEVDSSWPPNASQESPPSRNHD